MHTCSVNGCKEQFETEESLFAHMKGHTKEDRSQAKSVRRKAREKTERIPLSVPRRKLSVSGGKDNGRVYRWINEKDARLHDAQAGSWRFEDSTELKVGDRGNHARKEDGTRICRRVNAEGKGLATHAYLMSIDRDLYEADQAAKQTKIDKFDGLINQQKHGLNEGEARYVPDEGQSIGRK